MPLREALCRECQATIFWLEMVPIPREGGGQVHPMHPVDYLQELVPMVGLLGLSAKTNRAMVLRKDDVESGSVQRWLENGSVTLWRSHYATCPKAQAVRERNPNQETLNV